MHFHYPFGSNNREAYALWAHTFPEADTIVIRDCRFQLFKPVLGGDVRAFLHDNEFYHGGADGVQASAAYVHIFDNLFSQQRYPGLGYGVVVNYAGTVSIENNVFDNTRILGSNTSEHPQQATVYVNGAAHVTIRNNVIRQARRPFIWFYANGIIENNTLIDTGDPFAPSSVEESYFYQRHTQTTVIRNNVFYKSARFRFGLSCDDCDSTGWITLSYNSFWPPMDSFFVPNSGDPPERIKVFDSMNVNAYPMLTPDSLFRLQAQSPAIDAGDPTILDVDGSPSDMGWTGGPGGYSYSYEDYPPLAPESLWVTGSDGIVQVTWHSRPEADLKEYRLYRGESPGFWIPGLPPLSEFPPGDTATVDTILVADQSFYYVATAVDTAGLESSPSPEGQYILTGVFDDPEMPALPRTPSIMRVYPNPFNAAVSMDVYIPDVGPRPAPAEITIYNLLGRVQATAFAGHLGPGRYQLIWDGRATDGSASPSGLYFARLQVWNQEFSPPVKLVLLR
jgi:hypothetical protein